MGARVLIVDDELSMREMLGILFEKTGYEVVLRESVDAATESLAEQDFDLVISDLRLGQRSGIEVLERAKAQQPHAEVIMITAYADTRNAIQAMKLGAYDYLEKPFRKDELLLIVEKALERRNLRRENEALRSRLESRKHYAGLLGKSPAMQELFELVEKVAPSRATVLILGESGVGKELVARALHERGARAESPFVAVNCGAIPEGLIESELFGHEKGAFTGANLAKQGLFEAASGGTLFLDEVGELPPLVQVKLLRALQQRSIRPVGGVRDIPIDVRIVAATHRDLEEEVRQGRFREDLYYRLNVIGLKVPPLRQRREDILLLAEHFLERFALEMEGGSGGTRKRLSKEVQRLLLDHSFPGNVRELENIIERAVTLADGDEIGPELLPPELRRGGRERQDPLDGRELPEGFDLQGWLDEKEALLLRKGLEESGGVKTEAARRLGISFRSLRYRLEKLSIEYEDDEESASG